MVLQVPVWVGVLVLLPSSPASGKDHCTGSDFLSFKVNDVEVVKSRAAPAEDWNWAVSARVGQLRSAWKSSPWGSWPSPGLCRDLQSQAHGPTQWDTTGHITESKIHLSKRRNKVKQVRARLLEQDAPIFSILVLWSLSKVQSRTCCLGNCDVLPRKLACITPAGKEQKSKITNVDENEMKRSCLYRRWENEWCSNYRRHNAEFSYKRRTTKRHGCQIPKGKTKEK